jgi:hypothetical protein
LIIYNSGTKPSRSALATSELDYLGAGLFACSVILVLVGLSLAGNTYSWVSWEAILPVSLGGLFLLLFVSRELHSSLASIPERRAGKEPKLLLGIRYFWSVDAVATFTSVLFVGIIVRALLDSSECCYLISYSYTRSYSFCQSIILSLSSIHGSTLRYYSCHRQVQYCHVP